MAADRKNFSLLVKPVSFDCNLRCHYCFYLKKEALFGQGRHRMPDPVLERMIASYTSTRQTTYSFGWQGGEPTLAGLDFFQRAVNLMETCAPPGSHCANALQTNGTLLDDAWGEFLARYRFLVGISVDGPPAWHDANRVRASGAGSHADVMRGLAVLRRHRVEFNVLTLVSAVNVADPLTLYRYLRDELGLTYHQYIECVETADDGSLRPCSVTPESWGSFLCRLFDEWYEHDQNRVSVRLFDTILHKLLTGEANTCAASHQCGQYLVVEHDGSVYPCDFFVQPDCRLGNLMRQPLDRLLNSAGARAFAKRKLQTPPACRSCPYYRHCAGDCPKNRRGDGHSRLCAGWQRFYQHALPRLQTIADSLRTGARPPHPPASQERP